MESTCDSLDDVILFLKLGLEKIISISGGDRLLIPIFFLCEVSQQGTGIGTRRRKDNVEDQGRQSG